MAKVKRWIEEMGFWLRTGATLKIVNDGKPIEELVIKHNDIYFGIDIDVESGMPTGDFGWSPDPMMFHTPTREHYKTILSFPSSAENVHQQLRQEVLDLLTILVENGGMRYRDLELPKQHIDAAVERILRIVQ